VLVISNPDNNEFKEKLEAKIHLYCNINNNSLVRNTYNDDTYNDVWNCRLFKSIFAGHELVFTYMLGGTLPS
jgi:hypothetical protein